MPMPMTTPRPHSRQPKQLDAGIFQAEISSFALRLAADGRAAKTIETYTEAVQWFAATCLPGLADWEQVSSQDVQRWMAWLLDRYSSAYASNQYRALQQFFKWLPPKTSCPTR
jgi:site-specific recombinase XerD